MILPPDLVIFDCDGVLVDSEPVTNLVLRDSLAMHGLHLQLSDVIDLFVGGTIASACAQARERGAQLPDTWVDDIYAEMFAALSENCPIIEGVVPLLDALDSHGIPVAVGSNGPHAKMRITLTKTGLWDRFEGRIVSREDVSNPKPAPDVYLKAAAGNHVSPARCVVIEDSSTGARAAKAAGMACFGFDPAGDSERLPEICDAVFNKMTDLPLLLGLT